MTPDRAGKVARDALPLTFDRLMARTDAPAGSTWGLNGEGDEAGMINVLTSARVLDAVGTVRRGAVFNLDLPLDAFEPHFSTKRSSPTHDIFGSLMPHQHDDCLDRFCLQGSRRSMVSVTSAIPSTCSTTATRKKRSRWARRCSV